MAKKQRKYDVEFKIQAVKLAKEIGGAKAVAELGITKADREARKSDDLLKRDFTYAEPLKKCVTDITEIKAKDGKLYVSAIFDCYDATVLGLAMDTNMKVCQSYKKIISEGR